MSGVLAQHRRVAPPTPTPPDMWARIRRFVRLSD